MEFFQDLFEFFSENRIVSVIILFFLVKYVKNIINPPLQEKDINGSLVINVSSTDHWKELLEKSKDSNSLMVVDFFATWCPPCKTAAPYYAMMSKEFPNVIFVKVDVDKCSEVSKLLNIKSMPTFKIFNNGNEISEILGYNESKIREIISSNITSKGK